MWDDLTGFNAARMSQAAFRYTHRVPVFPLKPGDSVPNTMHGFKDAALLDNFPEDRREWILEAMQAIFEGSADNIGIRTGDVVDVLDFDVKNGEPGLRTLQTLYEAGLLAGAVAYARTPSGGKHVYFPAAGQRSRAVREFGLDLKAIGGYVAAAPSERFSMRVEGSTAFPDIRRYEWEWARDLSRGRPLDWDRVVDVLKLPRPGVRPGAGWVPDEPYGSMVAPSDMATGLGAWLMRQRSGERNRSLYWACCRAIEAGCRSTDDMRPLIEASYALSERGEDRMREIVATVNSALRRFSAETGAPVSLDERWYS